MREFCLIEQPSPHRRLCFLCLTPADDFAVRAVFVDYPSDPTILAVSFPMCSKAANSKCVAEYQSRFHPEKSEPPSAEVARICINYMSSAFQTQVMMKSAKERETLTDRNHEDLREMFTRAFHVSISIHK